MERADTAAGQQPSAEQRLTELRAVHGSTYAIGREGNRWQAARRDGVGLVLSRASAPGLDMALRISR